MEAVFRALKSGEDEACGEAERERTFQMTHIPKGEILTIHGSGGLRFDEDIQSHCVEADTVVYATSPVDATVRVFEAGIEFYNLQFSPQVGNLIVANDDCYAFRKSSQV